MTWEIALVLGLTVLAFAAMAWELWSPDAIALSVMALLLVSGILTADEAFGVFGNEAPITVGCMFVLSAALERTGLLTRVARKIDPYSGNADWQVMLVMLPVVGLISAFVNNTPIVVIFMPVFVSLAARRQIAASKLLIPLSYAAIFGGCCTLVGTSTNLLVSEVVADHGLPRLGMFELTAPGLIMALGGLVYLTILGRKLLPNRETLATLLQTTETKQYLTEAVIVAGSPLVGRRLLDTPLRSLPDFRVLDITRGGEPLATPLNEVVLEEGDRLRLTTVLSGMMEIKGLRGIEILPQADLGLRTVGLQKAALVESVIGPNSQLIGKTIRQVNFRQRYGVLILAVHRQGRNLRRNFETVRLRFGDTILIEGSEPAIQRLRDDRNFLLLVDVPQTVPRREKTGLALGILGLVIVLATFKIAPISILALAGVLAVLVTRCLEIDQAYGALPWRLLFLIFGMLSLGKAMEKTEAAQMLADGLIGLVGQLGPLAVLSAVYFFTSLLTEVISNNAVAVLLTPVAIATAHDLGVDPRAFVMAIAFGASASFATPIGYQTNTLVYGAGGYKFRDFIKVGLPLNLLFWLLATVLLPWFWPLTPAP